MYIFFIYLNFFYNTLQYIHASVLLENNEWRIFHIFTSEDIDVIHLKTITFRIRMYYLAFPTQADVL